MTILAESLAAENLTPGQSESCPDAPFLLYWRFRATHPWNLEQFSERPKAHNRFFNLLQRGIEARFEANRQTAAGRSRPSRRTISLRETGAVTSPNMADPTVN